AMRQVQKYFVEKSRLGIPVLTTTEALHGAVQDSCTVYPQALALGSTFNPELVTEMTRQISQELKAMGVHQVLSPVLDLARELRWGRVEETYGEDPFLNGTLGVAFIQGFHENKIICTPKHFVAHGSPNGGLNLASVPGGERELRSIYLVPFEKVIQETNPLSAMNGYSAYDAVPVAASKYYLTDILRNELNFKGYVYSDWGSVDMLHYFHQVANNRAEAAVQAVEAGIDLEAAGSDFLELEKRVTENKFDIKYIDQAVSRILYVKFACGLFENPAPDLNQIKTARHTPESVALARNIAEESIVLLKNENILPLQIGKYKSIAMLGPHADQIQFGDYSWTRDNQYGVTIKQGIESLVGNKIKINYAPGCDAWSLNTNGFDAAVQMAQKSDLAIVVVGTQSASLARDYQNATCGEGYDLSDLKLPGVQAELVQAVKATGKPLIVVLVAGKPLAIPYIKENANAILVQWYGGEQQGHALAKVLFGKVNPSGKLNVSFPQSVGHLPCYYNYLPTDKGYYKKSGALDKPGRDYVFSNPAALWSFGHGLSYTTFDYPEASLSVETLNAGDTLTVTVQVKNSGNLDGREVVQLYVRDVVSSVVTPVKQLKAFKKVLVPAGATVSVKLKSAISDWFLINREMKRVVEPGEYELQIGPASDNIKIKKIIQVN
ncbi:glycoside hydrolase family 3 C-terminal domain-containing protein, partial [candidate division KSB1 bacterium]|nr:glycoside hydrolase family 3 C-terminal domain-containing protein [candidate division KSB1 bacterium]